MNVLVVSSKYPPEYSGSGLRAHRTYLRLKEKFDIDVEVIASSTESNIPETYVLDGISVERVVSKNLRSVDRAFRSTPVRRLTNAILAHREARTVKRKLAESKFDVIHTFGYSPATAAAIDWSRKHQIPLLLELVNPMATPYQFLPGTRRFSEQDLDNQSIVVAISKSLGEMCASHGIVDNVWVRPNPVDIEKFSPDTSDARSAARNKISNVSDDEILVVYVAKYLTRKNHTFLIDALTKLPGNFRLLLAGPPLTDRDLVPGLTAKQIPSLMDKANELGVGDRVEVSHGFVDMQEYLAAADVFCFPAEREAMGTPLLESISSGVPVVANADEPSFREWVIDDENGYLRPLNPDDWAEAIIKAAEFSQDQKLSMSEKIKQSISTVAIDQQYNRLLQAAAATRADQQINVEQVLSS